jgi:hypothetical protein
MASGNAFGNIRHILQQVSWSPMMGGYLTYQGSSSLASSATLPDEVSGPVIELGT